MHVSADLTRHRREFARAVANKSYEFTDNGILFPKQKAIMAGAFETWVNGRDHDISPNLITTEGLTNALSNVVHNLAQVHPWYVALYSGNVTPQPTLTAANFVANQTEYTGYSETVRQTYVEAAPAAGATDNSASLATFTIVTPATLYGGALLSAQAKSSVAGWSLAVAAFSAGRAVLAGDSLQAKYSLSLTSS